jgi:hypothetical protein
MRIFAIYRGGVVLLGGPAPFEGICQSKTWNTRPLCVFGTILLVGKNLPVESKKFGKPSELRSNRTRFVAVQPMNRPEAAGVDACPVAPSAFDAPDRKQLYRFNRATRQPPTSCVPWPE